MIVVKVKAVPICVDADFEQARGTENSAMHTVSVREHGSCKEHAEEVEREGHAVHVYVRARGQ